MILRLVYSFFFFSLVTGDMELDNTKTAAGAGYCENQICVCRDNLKTFHRSSPSISYQHKIVHQGSQRLTPHIRVEKTTYGYAPTVVSSDTAHIIASPAAKIETNRFSADFVPENEGYQVPRSVYTSMEDSSEKKICFSPKMVHRVVKAALEYVRLIPADITYMVKKLENELNKMQDIDSLEDLYIKEPLYPLDSRTIFQMLKNKPKSEIRKHLLLKYELPGAKEPQCKDSLEKLIEITNAYLELEQHPQCRDYIYKFASHQAEDRPEGLVDYEPDMPSLVASILEQVDKAKPRPLPEYNRPDYDNTGEIDIPMPEIPIPQIQEVREIRIPHIPEMKGQQIHEYRIPEVPEHGMPRPHEMNIPRIPEMNIPQIHEYTVPKIHGINVPQVNEYNVPKIPQYNGPKYPGYNGPNNPEYNGPKMPEYNIPEYPEYNGPKNPEYNGLIPPEYNGPIIPEYNDPKNHYKGPINPEYNGPINPEYNGPKIPEYNVPKIPEYNDPKIHEYNDTKILEYNDLKIHEINVPQIHEITEYQVPKIHEITEYHIPKIHEITEYQVPQIHKINSPQIIEYHYPKIHEIYVPQIHKIHEVHEYTTPQIHGYNIPQIHEIEIPTIEDTKEITLMQPNETYEALTNILKNDDNPGNGDLFDRLMDVVANNKKNFHPQVYDILTTFLNSPKQRNIPRLTDIISFIVDSEKKKQWPWSDRTTNLIRSFLVPDRNGNTDPRIVDIILDFYNKPTSEKQIEYILSLLKPIKEGVLDPKIVGIVINLIKANINTLLLPEHIETLLKLLKPSRKGIHPKKIDIVDNVSRWNEIGLTPNQLDKIIMLLKPDVYGNTDPRVIDIIHFLISQNKYLNPKHLDFILAFLTPDNGVVDLRRIDVTHFLLISSLHPKLVHRILQLLQENPLRALNSRFLEILLFLNSNRLLTPQLAETVIQILSNDITGQLDDDLIKFLFYQLAPLKQTHPKIVVDILTILNQGGLHGDIVKWLESTNNDVGIPNHDSSPPSQHVIPGLKIIDPDNQYRTPDDGYQTDEDFLTIMKWLDTQGLLNADKGSNADLVNNLMKILNMGQREFGVVELTYMLKHEKPLIYQPVYYVKYRLPVLNFITNMKNILLEHPQLTADPMKLLQELIVNSNVTEVSPNLQGYPKEEIVKLTVNDGDLVQAKLLDEQNLTLNEQITQVHELNSEISPEELLQLNKVNEAKYYPDVIQYRGTYPERVTMHDNKIMKFPTVHYRQMQVHPLVPHHTHRVHFIGSTERKNNEQYSSSE